MRSWQKVKYISIAESVKIPGILIFSIQALQAKYQSLMFRYFLSRVLYHDYKKSGVCMKQMEKLKEYIKKLQRFESEAN